MCDITILMTYSSYVQVIVVTELWFRVSIVFSVECLFIVGLCNMLLYYGFLHPVSYGPEDSDTPQFER